MEGMETSGDLSLFIEEGLSSERGKCVGVMRADDGIIQQPLVQEGEMGSRS
jgi:hypothetical protein